MNENLGLTELPVELQVEIEELKEKLPSNWVKIFLNKSKVVLDKSYDRSTPYKILNEGKKSHDGWKIIESIAKDHQEKLATL